MCSTFFIGMLGLSLLTSTVWGGKTIPLNSDPEIVGINSVSLAPEVLLTPETIQSWKPLPSFTEQTIENFAKGEKKGILYVHSFEDMMGVQGQFIAMGNEEHSNDQRSQCPSKDTIDIFGSKNFVENYTRYILERRPILSGSIITFNQNPLWTAYNTFGPVNLILTFPVDCLAVTAFCDARTPVCYFDKADPTKLKNCADYVENKPHPWVQESSHPKRLLYTLIRFPELNCSSTTQNFSPSVFAQLRIAISFISGEKYTPRVAGVLINKALLGGKFDYGNAYRNKKLESSARQWAKEKGLPVLEFDESCISQSVIL